jgi:16S rRNA (guanine(966)-N(2))-methyltransferase RsmD
MGGRRTLRITGGVYLGRRVTCPPGDIRPAMDRMRESMFAILGDLSNLSFLDLFSGSGVVAIEAASRGASPVYAVEKDPRKRATLERNVSFVDPPVVVRTMSVEAFLRRPPLRFDVVYVDPPFAYRFKADLVERAAAAPLLSDGGLLLIHTPSSESLPRSAGTLRLFDSRRYGGSLVTFYRVDP